LNTLKRQTLKHLTATALTIVCAIALTCSLSPQAFAQSVDNYPNRPIKIVVAFGPGGGSDTLARMLGQKLSETFKQTVVIENKPGAGGSIGTREVQKASPDGYTLILATSSTHGINPWVIKNIGYDAVKDFTHVAVFANTDYALAVPTNSPYKTLADLVNDAQTKKLDYASSGNGSNSHLAGALLGQMTKSNLVHVPYKSSDTARTDLLGGQVAFMFDNTAIFLPFAKGGKLRILATSGPTRSSAAKETPTLTEAGVPGFEVMGWFALTGPANMPPAVVAMLNREVQRIMALPDIRDRMATLGFDSMPIGVTESPTYVAVQLGRYKAMVQAAGAQAD
jgi:tripartite-type tricarboxylate transporter receptor subunit TctC